MNKTTYSGKKKIISLLLAAVMIAAMVAPLSVSATATAITVNVSMSSIVAALNATPSMTISGNVVGGTSGDTIAIAISVGSGGSITTTSKSATIDTDNATYTTSYTFGATDKGAFTIIASINGYNDIKTVTLERKLDAPTGTSGITINFANEEVIFSDAGPYKVKNSSIYSSSNAYELTSTDFDSDLSIYKAGAAVNYTKDSDEYTLPIPARFPTPGSSDYTYNTGVLTLSGTPTDYEYKEVSDTSYTTIGTSPITLNSSKTYDLRKKTDSSTKFASLPATLPPSTSNRETTPSATIDHANHQIYGLVAGAQYKINGYYPYTANSAGRISISSVMLSTAYQRWDTVYGGYSYAYDINIVKMATDSTKSDSLTQSLIYYTNQGYGYNHLSAVNETGAGRNDGYIYGMQSAYSYEYKFSSEPASAYRTLSRSSINSNRSVNLAPGTYDVRINYYNNYANYVQTLTIYPHGTTGWVTATVPSFSAEYYGYSYRPSAHTLTIYNPSSQTAYINSVTVSGSSFDVYGSASSVSAGNSLSSYTVQPRANLSPGTYTETVTVTYNLGSVSTVYTASAQVSFTVWNDYYDYYDYSYSYGSPTTSSKTSVTDSTTRTTGSINGVLSYYNKAEKTGEVDIAVTAEAITGAIERMRNERSQRGKSTDSLDLTVNFTTSGGYSPKATVELSSGALTALVSNGVNLTIVTDTGSITFPSGALRTINSASSAGCVIKVYKDSKLSDSLSSLIGSRPVVEFKVYGVKGTKMSEVSSFGTQLSVSINYTPGSNEKTGNLGVYRISGGKATLMKNSSYSNGVMTWSGNSLSMYAVGYDKAAPEFKDTETHWAKENIEFAALRGILTGTGTDVFSPDTEITRTMFITALGRLSGENMSLYKSEKTFTDVGSSSFYYTYVEWAYANGIIDCPEDGKFAPNSAITREDMAVMMYKYAAYANYKIPSNTDAILFSDADAISAEAKSAVKAMQTAGIMQGKNNSLIDPQGKATRAEASAVLQRFVVNVIDASPERGWVQESANGRWQYINGKGETSKGWTEISRATYYFENNGYMATGWLTLKEDKYYFGDNGVMAKLKWVKVGSDWYYFDMDGALVTDTTVEGYKVDATGARK